MKLCSVVAFALALLSPWAQAQDPVATQDLPTAVLERTPADGLMYVRIASLDALDQAKGDLLQAVTGSRVDKSRDLPTEAILAEFLAFDITQLDRTRPLLLCLPELPIDAGTPYIAFVPVAPDVPLSADRAEDVQVTLLDAGYAALVNGAELPPVGQGDALIARLRPGVLAIALRRGPANQDLLRFGKELLLRSKSQNAAQLEAERFVPQPQRDLSVSASDAAHDALIDFIDSFADLSVVFDVQGGSVTFDLDAALTPGSPLTKRDLAERPALDVFAQAIDPQACVSFLLNVDFGALVAERLDTFVEGTVADLTAKSQGDDRVPSGWANPLALIADVGQLLQNTGATLAELRGGAVLNVGHVFEIDNLESFDLFTHFELWSHGADLAKLQAVTSKLIESRLLERLGLKHMSVRDNNVVHQLLRFDQARFESAVANEPYMVEEGANLAAWFAQQRGLHMLQAGELVRIALDDDLPTRAPSVALERAMANLGGTPPLAVMHANIGPLTAMFAPLLTLSFFDSKEKYNDRTLEALAGTDVPVAAYLGMDTERVRLGFAGELTLFHRSQAILDAGPIPPPPTQAQLDAFEYDVLPIFEASCTRCHGERRQKEDLRLDSFEMLMQGSERGPVFKAGNADESLIIKLMRLPLDDDDHMPPADKRQPTAADIATIEAWINSLPQ